MPSFAKLHDANKDPLATLDDVWKNREANVVEVSAPLLADSRRVRGICQERRMTMAQKAAGQCTALLHKSLKSIVGVTVSSDMNPLHDACPHRTLLSSLSNAGHTAPTPEP